MIHMPVVLRHKGYRLFFYSNEGNPLEPLHVHVRKAECVAKFWIEPEVCLDGCYGFAPSEIRELSEVVRQNREMIERRWHEYFDN